MLRITTEWSGGGGGNYYTTLHTGGTTPGEAIVLANATSTLWLALDDQLHESLTAHVPNEVQQIDVATGEITAVFPVTAVNIPMTNVQQALPWTTQALIRLRTGVYVAGRELRGRVFVPGPVETENDAGRPTNTFLGILEAAFENWGSNTTAAGGPVIFSPTHLTASPVNAVQPWTEWAVLRSRRD